MPFQNQPGYPGNMQGQPQPYYGYAQQNQLPPQTAVTSPAMPQAMPRSFFQGRLVHQHSDIQPADVPTDGSVAIFLQDDYKTIYVKSWFNGGINTWAFDLRQSAPDAPAVTMDALMTKLNNIETQLKKRQPPYPSQKKGEQQNA